MNSSLISFKESITLINSSIFSYSWKFKSVIKLLFEQGVKLAKDSNKELVLGKIWLSNYFLIPFKNDFISSNLLFIGLSLFRDL